MRKPFHKLINEALVFIFNFRIFVNKRTAILPYRERDIEKKYFSIGEVAEMFKVATSLIRYWEGEFDIIKPKKDKKGNRRFTKDDIEKIRLIFHLVKEKGYTLQGAQDIIKKDMYQINDKAAMIDRLHKIKSFLVEIRNNLDAHKSQ